MKKTFFVALVMIMLLMVLLPAGVYAENEVNEEYFMINSPENVQGNGMKIRYCLYFVMAYKGISFNNLPATTTIPPSETTPGSTTTPDTSGEQQGTSPGTGVWKIDMGMLTFSQTGNNVSGSFEFTLSGDGGLSGWCRPDGYEDWEDSIETGR